ncbi:MAG: HlyD family secretion protein [Bdellovibrionaceae bacterium]|nr:HlyD family secretion protein [Pseudobdellovibrionaceae bacterium]
MNQSNKNKILLSVASGVVVLLVTYFTYQHLSYVETDNAQVEAHSVLISAKVPGYIKEVHVTDGMQVKKGDLLVQIDDRDYSSLLSATKSEVTSLEARKKDAEKNYFRLKDLYAKSVVSAQQYDGATAAYNDVKARYDSAQARVAQAELNFEYTQLKAPSDGVIARYSAEVGQLANPGTPLVGFVSSDARWIVANFKETEIIDITVGKTVDIKVDALSGRTYVGEVESISSATGATFSLLPPDNATGNFTKVVQRVPVKIKINNLTLEDKLKLQAGLSATVKVHIR